MKPFITPEISVTGKKVLAFQCEGIEPNAAVAPGRAHGQQIVAYAMPSEHSFQAAWLFWLILGSGEMLEFSSACTQIVDWQEVGTLNIRFIGRASDASADSHLHMATVAVPTVRLQALEKLVYEDADVVSECALILRGEGGKEIVVAAGIPPGSVSVSASFNNGAFEPQFEISACRRERL